MKRLAALLLLLSMVAPAWATNRVYNCQDNAGTAAVADTGGGAQNGTAGANTSTLSTASGPGNTLPRAFHNAGSIAIPGLVVWTVGGTGTVAFWTDATDGGVMGDSGGSCGLFVSAGALIGELDSGDGFDGPSPWASGLHHYVFSTSSGTTSYYRDKVLIGTGDNSAGAFAVNALCDNGADNADVPMDAGNLCGVTLAPGVAWNQSQVNADYARGVNAAAVNQAAHHYQQMSRLTIRRGEPCYALAP